MSVDRQLGLKRGIVRIVTHDPAWGNAYVRTSTRARSTLEGLPFDMEHVGSTSVPGLDAKPIIDVAIGVPEALIPEAVQRLAARLLSSDRERRSDALGGGRDHRW